MTAFFIILLYALASLARSAIVSVPCTGGYRGNYVRPALRPAQQLPSAFANALHQYSFMAFDFTNSARVCACAPAAGLSVGTALEQGIIVGLMPPDAPVPTGGYAIPGGGSDALMLGDTVGRTPGAYGSFVSCSLTVSCRQHIS